MCFFYPPNMHPLDKYCDMLQCAACLISTQMHPQSLTTHALPQRSICRLLEVTQTLKKDWDSCLKCALCVCCWRKLAKKRKETLSSTRQEMTVMVNSMDKSYAEQGTSCDEAISFMDTHNSTNRRESLSITSQATKNHTNPGLCKHWRTQSLELFSVLSKLQKCQKKYPKVI